MYRLLSMDRRILILVSVLILIAFAVLWFKVHVLKFSLLPSPETELWLLECRVKFETPGGPVKASISMPNEVPGYFLTGVSTTPGFRFESEDRDDRLVATWSGIAEGGAHTILYQMRLIPDRYAGLIADSIDPLRKPVWSDAAAAAAAVSFLKSVDPDGRAKPEVLIPNVLKQLGVRPDFESSVPLRYIHRKSGGMDIYMISNPTGDSIAPSCTFRVSGKQVTLWDAVQGKIAPAVADQSDEVTTTLNLNLEPHGSLFVIFADVPMDSICNTETLHPDLEPAVEVKGPWKVAFQEHRGAPDSARFDRLIDWSQHSDPRIRYFSGIADYDTSFELPAAESAQTKWYIDLGDVSVMARVVVNGETVTELWKAPYRCDITPYVKAGENRRRK